MSETQSEMEARHRQEREALGKAHQEQGQDLAANQTSEALEMQDRHAEEMQGLLQSIAQAEEAKRAEEMRSVEKPPEEIPPPPAPEA